MHKITTWRENMNTYIHAQILNMQAMVQTFERACEMAAMKDDGKVSRDEEKQLKKIKAAAQAFQKELGIGRAHV